ncbi:MAG TPA: hypothetical protein VF190_11450 [Rhodothermales bacterium]
MSTISPLPDLVTPDSGTTLDERPALRSLQKAAICLHFVDDPTDLESVVRGDSKLPEPGDRRVTCSVFCSMELDLIAYKFQDQFLLQTNLTYDEAVDVGHCIVEAVFPGTITYTSEGSQRTLRSRAMDGAGDCVIRCEARLAQTHFRESGIVVWHLVLRGADEVFTEYELIKLMHLYEGDSEQVDLPGRVQFDVRRPGETVRRYRCGVDGLLHAVWSSVAGGDFLKPPFFEPFSARRTTSVGRRPRAGTLQLVTGDTLGGQKLESVFRTLYEAREEAHRSSDGAEGMTASRRLKSWLRDPDPEGVGAALKAIAGATIGIFDFPEVDEEEVLDTLDPTFQSGMTFMKFHRRSLVGIGEADRGLDAVYEDFGASPYLILPHAVVLADEHLVDRLEACLDAYGESTDIPALERLAAVARRVLRRMHVPNLFQYVTEKTLYERAFEVRGSAQLHRLVRERVEELDRHLEKTYERRRRRHDVFVQALLLVLTVAQVVALFVGDMPDLGFERALIAGLLIAAAGTYILIRAGR